MLFKKGLKVVAASLSIGVLGSCLVLPSTAATLTTQPLQFEQASIPVSNPLYKELAQWDPAPEDAGQCSGKKCAGGGSY